MSPKDPLLRSLKVCILNLQSEGKPVTDDNPHLVSCCELLELVLRKGLQQAVMGLVHRDYWHCFEQILQQDTCGRLSTVSLAVEQTATCRKLLTAQGRGRFFLRLALNRRFLESAVKHVLHTPKVIECYNPSTSILRNEEYVEPFLSLLLVLSEMEFKLNIENSSFLDESWLLPVCQVYEAVPCRELGMVLRYLCGRVFVLELLPGSQAQVDGCVQPGDLLDEINGISLRNARNGQAGAELSRLKGQPLTFRVLRWRGADGGTFRPLVKPLRVLKLENPSLQLGPVPQQPISKGARHGPLQCLKEGRVVYIVRYLGKTNIGMYGGKEVLKNAIGMVLEKNVPAQEVLLDLKETHLTCSEKSNKKDMFQLRYPEISCVGRSSQPDITVFAFCFVDSPETPEMGFSCAVLQAGSSQQCEEIVNRVAAGFKHTEWFV